MAEYAIAIEKETSFQGTVERWSNAYTFSTDIGEEFDDNANITWLVALERAVHMNTVAFKSAKSYGIGGSDAGNVMREVRDLSGNGTPNSQFEMYRECAILIQFELPRSLILRRKRVGRKWLHVGAVPSSSGSVSMAAGASPLDTTAKNFYLTNYATKLVTETPPGGGVFASAGDPFTNPRVFDYVEHRQFHRGRKE